MKIVVVGDSAVKTETFVNAVKEIEFSDKENNVVAIDWETNSQKFSERIRNIEENGPNSELPPDELVKEIEDADILLVHWVPLGRKLIESAKKLKIIAVCRGGLDNLDFEAAKEKGIKVFHVIRNSEPVAEFTVGLILSEMRNIARGHEAMRKGSWLKAYSNSENKTIVKGKTVGLVGYGNIGKLVVKKLSGFDVKFLVYDPFVSEEKLQETGLDIKKVSLEELCKTSDIITLHMRLVKETENIMNEKTIGLMKKTAYLINTSRAGLIEENALYNALKNKNIAGAALDVFWEEPLPDNSRFAELDNITFTPHEAGNTIEALANSPYLLAYIINDYFKTGKSDMLLK